MYRSGQYDGNRLHNGQLEYNLSGQSGQDDYQNRASQNIPNKGPIPDGTYWADQKQRQTITPLQAGCGIQEGKDFILAFLLILYIIMKM